MKSIMHNKSDRTCYLCMMLHDDYSEKIVREEHHVPFGRGIRPLSEKYGLKVYLCLLHHRHDGGEEAVHKNPDIRRMLDKKAQLKFEEMYPDKDFRKIFGKNYLEEADRQQNRGNEKKEGICFLSEPLSYDLGW